MKANPKVLIALAVAGGLAFFFVKKSQAQSVAESGTVSTGAGAGIVAGLVAIGKKVFGVVKKILAPAAAVADLGGALGGALASGGSVVVVGEAIPGVALASGGEVTVTAGSGAAGISGGGIGSVLGPAIALSIPVIFGPPLVSLLTGNKTLADMEAEGAARDKAAAEAAAVLLEEGRILAAANALKEIAGQKVLSLPALSGSVAVGQ